VNLGILVNAFARTAELRACLESILESSFDLVSHRLLVHQKGVPKSINVSKSFSRYFEIIYVEPLGDSPLERINNSRVFGLTQLFDFRGMDAVLAIEDDVEIANDAVKFCRYIYEMHCGQRAFRGINLGSRIPRSENLDELGTFSILRYGLHGQAGLITRETWAQIKRWRLGKANNSGFDSQIEALLKTGYMVTPNHSRYLDRGYDEFATHAIKDELNPTFVSIKDSYVGKVFQYQNPYLLKQVSHENWRRDAIKYKKFENLKYWILFLMRKFIPSFSANLVLQKI
jgi:hypothetical protein